MHVGFTPVLQTVLLLQVAARSSADCMCGQHELMCCHSQAVLVYIAGTSWGTYGWNGQVGRWVGSW